MASVQKRATQYRNITAASRPMANENKRISTGRSPAPHPQSTVKQWNQGVLHGPTTK